MTKHTKPPVEPGEPATTGELPPPSGIEAIALDKCNDAGDGYVTVTIDADPAIKRGNGDPSEVGDVLSMQPDGTIQARESGARGAYELAKVSGNWLVFRPVNGGRCYLRPLATEWPNV